MACRAGWRGVSPSSDIVPRQHEFAHFADNADFLGESESFPKAVMRLRLSPQSRVSCRFDCQSSKALVETRVSHLRPSLKRTQPVSNRPPRQFCGRPSTGLSRVSGPRAATIAWTAVRRIVAGMGSLWRDISGSQSLLDSFTSSPGNENQGAMTGSRLRDDARILTPKSESAPIGQGAGSK
jgi:hypothetical protein